MHIFPSHHGTLLNVTLASGPVSQTVCQHKASIGSCDMIADQSGQSVHKLFFFAGLGDCYLTLEFSVWMICLQKQFNNNVNRLIK